MKRRFVENSRVRAFVDGSRHGRELMDTLQALLLEDPQRGDVIPGCGGFRKLRLQDPSRGKGKRGGHRVIYLDVPEHETTYFAMIYSKDERDDLAEDEKRMLRELAARLKG